jgi:hypothetical protein
LVLASELRASFEKEPTAWLTMSELERISSGVGSFEDSIKVENHCTDVECELYHSISMYLTCAVNLEESSTVSVFSSAYVLAKYEKID